MTVAEAAVGIGVLRHLKRGLPKSLLRVKRESIIRTELVRLERLGPFGKNAIEAYCKEGRDTYGIEFCKHAGY